MPNSMLKDWNILLSERNDNTAEWKEKIQKLE